MEIRKAEFGDAEEISKIVIDTIKNINSKDYSSEQIKVWVNSNSIENIRKKIQNKDRSTFVAIKNKEIVGYLAMYLMKNLLSSFYIKRENLGSGIGKKMIIFAEGLAKERGLKELLLESTLTAYSFYKSQGYILVKKENHIQEGVKIPIIKMKKEL
ncbi:MAG: GNAT family N-acetyltransferase [Nanoarchaeota archaeon]|nr:GNAT family N-acetyltransferase [Nanoarchaeota archaeon]